MSRDLRIGDRVVNIISWSPLKGKLGTVTRINQLCAIGQWVIVSWDDNPGPREYLEGWGLRKVTKRDKS